MSCVVRAAAGLSAAATTGESIASRTPAEPAADIYERTHHGSKLVSRAAGISISATNAVELARKTRAGSEARRIAASRLRAAARKLMVAAEILAPRCG